ncbi:hypothetical protein [Aneurinibacillus aneurinilyticus]|nr:hypothetical protein [Aneurinibacillus aneurinilyticus]MED0704911.1 hypothetical protein [Aneurinibacillus aneurinilyticus]MED0724047.1 hypothetical protein [Aneurinibacillus aneurinilyticus]MED0731956.1 hypothetical protein [Aneurinibacillus aneurinilyticus]MED0741514.1 hypothetical protein [Aneurinibacillus aneurinilyticus]
MEIKTQELKIEVVRMTRNGKNGIGVVLPIGGNIQRLIDKDAKAGVRLVELYVAMLEAAARDVLEEGTK